MFIYYNSNFLNEHAYTEWWEKDCSGKFYFFRALSIFYSFRILTSPVYVLCKYLFITLVFTETNLLRKSNAEPHDLLQETIAGRPVSSEKSFLWVKWVISQAMSQSAVFRLSLGLGIGLGFGLGIRVGFCVRVWVWVMFAGVFFFSG